MKKKRKIPLRKCIACNENKEKKELVRIVRTKDDGIVLDLTGKVNGRGAYLCKDISCIEKASKGNQISKVFKSSVDTEIYDKLRDLTKGE